MAQLPQIDPSETSFLQHESKIEDSLRFFPDNSFKTTFSISEKAITHHSCNRPTAYVDSTKLVGKVHSLETFLKLKSFNASTF